MKRITLVAAAFLTLLLLAGVMLTARASGQPQGISLFTPTPGPDGRIIYIVQSGDNCGRISLLTGVPIDQLRALNNLDENCDLTTGQPLLIGIGGPGGGTPTAGPAPTATLAPPTPTAIPGSIDVCVLLFDDLNGDALHEDSEPAIEGGAVSITGTSGQYSQTATTQAGTDPICFTKVPLGTYNVSVAPPSGYNPTTALNYSLEIKDGDIQSGIQAGDQISIPFGAQKSSAPAPANPSGGGDSNSLLGIIGGTLLLVGIGLAIYAWRVYGQRPKYMPPKSPLSK